MLLHGKSPPVRPPSPERLFARLAGVNDPMPVDRPDTTTTTTTAENLVVSRRIKSDLTLLQREGVTWAMKREITGEQFFQARKKRFVVPKENEYEIPESLPCGGGILAADMGLGKSLMIITLVMHDQEENEKEEKRRMTDFMSRLHLPIRKTLLVVSKKLIPVWRAELAKHVDKGAVKIHVYDSADEMEGIEKADIVITTYDRVLVDLKSALGCPSAAKVSSFNKGAVKRKHKPSGDGLANFAAWLERANTSVLSKQEIHALYLLETLTDLKNVDQAFARSIYLGVPDLAHSFDSRTKLVESPLVPNSRGLFGTHWWRVVVDEAHELRNSATKKYQSVLHLSATNRWWMSGTPYHNTIHDIGSGLLFLREPSSCAAEKGHDRKIIQDALATWMYRETIQNIMDNRPELIENDPRMSYLKNPCHQFEHAVHFGTLEERLVHDMLVEELKTVAQSIKDRRLGLNDPYDIGGDSVGEEDEEEDEAESIEDTEDEEEDEEESQNNKRQRLPEKPKPVAAPPPTPGQKQPLLTDEAKRLLRKKVKSELLNSGVKEAQMLLEYYQRAMQACALPVFARPKLAETGKLCYSTECTKMRLLVETIQQRIPTENKILVFSHWVKTLEAIEPVLKSHGISAVQFHGGIKDKDCEANIATFRRQHNLTAEQIKAGVEPGVQVLLIGLKVGNVGQTFTEASEVFFYDPWFNPQMEEQAFMRAYRIGQTKPVNVRRLIIAGSIEENVREKARAKFADASMVLKKGNNVSINADEVLEALSRMEHGAYKPRDEEKDYLASKKLKEKFTGPPTEGSIATDDNGGGDTSCCLIPYAPLKLAAIVPRRSVMWQCTTQDQQQVPSAMSALSKVEKRIDLDWLHSVCELMRNVTNELTAIAWKEQEARIKAKTEVKQQEVKSKATEEELSRKLLAAIKSGNAEAIAKVTEEARKAVGSTADKEAEAERANLMRPYMSTGKARAMLEALQPLYLDLYFLGGKFAHLEKGKNYDGTYDVTSERVNFTIKGAVSEQLKPLIHVRLDQAQIVAAAMAVWNNYHFGVNTRMTFSSILSLSQQGIDDYSWLEVPELFSEADGDEQAPITVTDCSALDYVAYTRSVLIPAMRTGDSGIVTCALLSFALCPNFMRPPKMEESPTNTLRLSQFDEKHEWSLHCWVAKRADKLVGIASAMIFGRAPAQAQSRSDDVFILGVYGQHKEELTRLLMEEGLKLDRGDRFNFQYVPDHAEGKYSCPTMIVRSVPADLVGVMEARYHWKRMDSEAYWLEKLLRDKKEQEMKEEADKKFWNPENQYAVRGNIDLSKLPQLRVASDCVRRFIENSYQATDHIRELPQQTLVSGVFYQYSKPPAVAPAAVKNDPMQL